MPNKASISTLDTHLGYWLRMVSNHVSHQFSLKVEAHGVTVAEWVVLHELLRVGDVNPSRLADEISMTRGAISKLIDRLAAKKLVTRASAGRDKRFQTVGLTAAGARLVPILSGLADKNDDEFFGFLTPEQRAALMATLRDIVHHRELNSVPVD